MIKTLRWSHLKPLKFNGAHLLFVPIIMHSFRTEKQNHFVIFDILYMEYSSNIGILLDFVAEKIN